MEFNMCNVIILLNKPLEEDIPFTTRSKAGRLRGCFMFAQYKQTCYWLKGKNHTSIFKWVCCSFLCILELEVEIGR